MPEKIEKQISESDNPKYPYHVIEPDTGVDVSFQTEQERQQWIEEEQARRKEK
jgi:hypothetical protein